MAWLLVAGALGLLCLSYLGWFLRERAYHQAMEEACQRVDRMLAEIDKEPRRDP